MTKLGYLNKYLLQFFFIRLTRVSDIASKEIKGYQIMYWVKPFSGYKGVGSYKYLNDKCNYLELYD